MPSSRLAAVLLVLVLGLAGAAAPARAHDNGLYLSLKYGSTDVDASFGDAFDQIVDGDDDAEAIEVGYRLNRHWAIQAGYHDLGRASGFGSPCDDESEGCVLQVIGVETDTEAWSLAIVPQLPLGKRLSVFGKVGIIASDTDVRAIDGFDDLDDSFSQENVLWGGGLRLQLVGPIQVFYEYESVGDELEIQSFGATWQF